MAQIVPQMRMGTTTVPCPACATGLEFDLTVAGSELVGNELVLDIRAELLTDHLCPGPPDDDGEPVLAEAA